MTFPCVARGKSGITKVTKDCATVIFGIDLLITKLGTSLTSLSLCWYSITRFLNLEMLSVRTYACNCPMDCFLDSSTSPTMHSMLVKMWLFPSNIAFMRDFNCTASSGRPAGYKISQNIEESSKLQLTKKKLRWCKKDLIQIFDATPSYP